MAQDFLLGSTSNPPLSQGTAIKFLKEAIRTGDKDAIQMISNDIQTNLPGKVKIIYDLAVRDLKKEAKKEAEALK